MMGSAVIGVYGSSSELVIKGPKLTKINVFLSSTGAVEKTLVCAHLDFAMGTEAIQLVQQLQHCPLNLTVPLLLTGKSLQQEINQP